MPVPQENLSFVERAGEPVLENGATSQFNLTSLLTFGKIPNGLTQAPLCGYALK
jgi:hypothetical protein